MNWLKEKLAGIVLAGVLRFLRNKHVHLIDTSEGVLDYFGEGRVIGGKLTHGPGGSVLGISLLWTSVGTMTPDYWHFPIERLRRDSVLGLVIDRA